MVIFGLLSLVSIAQNPDDAKLHDKLKANIGNDAEYIQSMYGTEKGDRLEGGAFSMNLVAGVLYRFTMGTSASSEVDVYVNLYLGYDKMFIKQQRVEPGKVASFEYRCEKTGDYAIRLTFKEKGKSYTEIILSKVKK